jgi:type VI secretion system secreted protein VgrG
MDALVGEKACLAWKGMEEQRWVHGIVSSFELTGFGGKLTYYSARLVPKLWLLTRRAQSQIFQNLATPDILKQMLEEGGIPADEFKLSLKRSYKPRKYCVQYRESDMDFISRLMEEEGIFYFFEHTEDGCTLHLSDDLSVHQPMAGTATVPYHPAQEGNVGGEAISAFRYGRSVRTGMVTLREFDFKKPSLDLTAELEADKWKELEAYDYPGAYPDSNLGKEYAKIRLEEEQARRELGEGEGNARQMVSGFKFTLEGYGRDAANQEYVLTRVHHWGHQPQAGEEEATSGGDDEEPTYQNDFTCIPAAVPFRPPRLTPRPCVDGPQTAVVTGPSGEEIHTDEFGRIKVRFHWDRSGIKDDKSSCWIRVSQGWGGAGWGAMHIPRIGQEVIVSFIEGDPDQPLVTGRVYNGENPPPYDLPGAKTQSTIKSNTTPGGGGSNEIRFEDAGGSEEVYIHAQKDQNEVVENDHTRTVNRNETIHVVKNRDKSVDVDQSETIGANKKISVGANHDEKIGGDKTMDVTGSHKETIHGSKKVNVSLGHTEVVNLFQNITIGGAKMLKVGAAYTQTIVGLMSETVGAAKKVKVSRNYDEIVNGNRKTKIKKDYTEEVKGTHSETITGDFVMHAKNIELMAEEKLFISVGGKAMMTLTKDGKIVIEGKSDMDIKAKDITIEGSKLNEKMSGEINKKGSKINLN